MFRERTQLLTILEYGVVHQASTLPYQRPVLVLLVLGELAAVGGCCDSCDSLNDSLVTAYLT